MAMASLRTKVAGILLIAGACLLLKGPVDAAIRDKGLVVTHGEMVVPTTMKRGTWHDSFCVLNLTAKPAKFKIASSCGCITTQLRKDTIGPFSIVHGDVSIDIAELTPGVPKVVLIESDHPERKYLSISVLRPDPNIGKENQ